MPLFCVTIFLGAFLLFQVQLVIAKCLLPWFGGTPAVWTTCMLFFQVLLVGGYAYAHKLSGLKPSRRQAQIHLSLLAFTVCLLAGQWLAWQTPILLDTSWKPTDASLPIVRILTLLAVSVGLPFFLLSTTSPLVQAWFSQANPERSPYWLYALSNAGSLLGLISYPFVVEPTFTLQSQAWIWTGCYVLFAGCCAGCALIAANAAINATSNRSVATAANTQRTEASSPTDAASRDNDTTPIIWPIRLAWLVLPAIASVLLLATTNKITEEIAVFPFLWVLTLALYLLTFILCFGNERVYQRWLFIPLAMLSWGALVALMIIDMPWGVGVDKWGIPWLDAVIDYIQSYYPVGVVWECGAFVLAMFASCMVCHGEVFRLRPPASKLTSYYLTTSIGGALGGMFVAIVAPLCFNGLWELHLGYIALGLAMLGVVVIYVRPAAEDGADSMLDLLLRWFWSIPASGVLAATIVVFAWSLSMPSQDAVPLRRNFYGVLRVKQGDVGKPLWHYYSLFYAGTMHGYQYQHPDKRRMITSYYTKPSGVAKAIVNHPKRVQNQPMRIGVVGLGTGTLAAYGRPGDHIRYYEINPAIVDLARTNFSFLKDSRANVDDIVMGDARLSLERELAQPGHPLFDVLAIDAFSGDAIPVHLITTEAFRVYFEHLEKDGILVVHVTNRYFDLPPVVWRLAQELNVHCASVEAAKNKKTDAYYSNWMLLSRSRATLQSVLKEKDQSVNGDDPLSHQDIELGPLWTDNYANLFAVIYRKEFVLTQHDDDEDEDE